MEVNMRNFIVIIIVLSMVLGILPSSVFASNRNICSFYTNFNQPMNTSTNPFVGTPTYQVDDSDPAIRGNYLQFNSMAAGNTTDFPKIKLAFPAVNVNTPDMYAVVQFDFRMANMQESKNIYIYLQNNTNKIHITPKGVINLLDNYTFDLRNLSGWSNKKWTRLQVVYRLSNSAGTPITQICGMYVNGNFVEIPIMTHSSTLSKMDLVFMTLSARKTTDSNTNDYSTDLDNLGVYIHYGSMPIIQNNTVLSNTINKYYSYLQNISLEVDENLVSLMYSKLSASADVANNALATSQQLSQESTDIANYYRELFFGDTYEERRALLNSKFVLISSLIEGIDNGTYNQFSTEEIARIRAIHSEINIILEDELAPLALIEKQISIVESIEIVLANNTYSVKNISVRKSDGTSVQAFSPGGVLEKVTLVKRNNYGFKGKIYMGFYDESGLLIDIISKEVDFTMTPVGDIEVNFLDENYILHDNVRNSKISIYLWNSDITPIIDKYSWQNLNNWEVYYNNHQIITDTMPMYEGDGNIYVGIKYLLNLMGIFLEKNGDLYYAQRDSDGNYMSFEVGNSYVDTHKGRINLDSPISYYIGNFALLPFDVISSVFGCAMQTVDDINNKMYITYESSNYKENFQELSKSGYTAVYTPDQYCVDYRIPVGDVALDVEVWYKTSSTAGDSSFNTSAFNNSMDTRYWRKATDPVRGTDNIYRGSIPYLRPNTRYDVKYVITKNGIKNTYVDKNAFITPASIDAKSTTIYNGDSLVLVPTYENMSFYVDYKKYTSATSCEVTYRKDSESQWHNAYTPFMDTVEQQFRGSIVNLSDNTKYHVKTIIKNASGSVLNEQTATCTTWSNSPNYTLMNAADLIPSNYTNEAIQFCGIKGTADNWIKIDLTGYTVNAGYNYVSAVTISDCEYVIIEGLKVEGGYRSGIAVNASCSNVRVSKCDVSKFGRTGIQRQNGWYYRDATPINYDAGILMLGASKITIENCYIHDSVAKTNAWSGSTWDSTHPFGSCGIYYRITDGCVIRYNDIIGSEENRWNDGIEGVDNNSYAGGPSKDTDIYGNMITYGQDDGIELDGPQMNVRVYKNRFEQFLCAISLITNLVGPSYVFDNVITNMGTEASSYAKAFKVGGAQNSSRSYIFNNTCFISGVISENINYNGYEYNFVTRNNIFVNYSGGSCYKNTHVGALNDNDYDFCYGNNVNYTSGGHSKLYSASTQEGQIKINQTQLYNKLAFVNRENGVLNLTNTSECKNTGTFINNFCEIDSPNMGALQGSNDFMPYRPVDIYADKYYVKISNSTSATVTIVTGGSGSINSYQILKSDSMNWIDVTSEESSQNGNITLNLTKSSSGDSLPHSGVIMFKLSNGYSIPITVVKS